MWSMENEEYGKWGVWKMGSMENEEYGKWGVWKMGSMENESMENAEYGKCGMENEEYDFSSNLVRYTALKRPRPMSRSFHLN